MKRTLSIRSISHQGRKEGEIVKFYGTLTRVSLILTNNMKCSCVSILSRRLQLILRNYYYWDDRRSHLMNGAGVPLEL